MLRRLILALLASAPLPAFANDSTAELGTGGLILSRTDSISMDSENLSISENEVKVDYVFTNHEAKDVDTIVAFPMPDIEGNPFWMAGIPDPVSDNFLDFTVSMDGKPINASLEQKAFAVGVDVTKELEAEGIPLNPNSEDGVKALAKLSDAKAQDWIKRGIIMVPGWDDGNGNASVERYPFWQLRSTFWWNAKFPAGKQVSVSHTYKPSVGGTSGVTFFYDGKFEGEYDRYVQKYCLDEPVKKAVLKDAKENGGYPNMYETRISYVLTTGGNWATGTIGKFKLTVDKGDPKNIVSFCGDGIKKTGPTTFEVNATDYYPARDVDILILKRWEGVGSNQTEGTADMAARSVGDAKPSADMAERGFLWGNGNWWSNWGAMSKRNGMVPGPKQGVHSTDRSRAPKGGAGDSGE